MEEQARLVDAQEPGLLLWEIREIKSLRAALEEANTDNARLRRDLSAVKKRWINHL